MSTADYLDGYRDGFRAGWQSAAATLPAERTAGAETGEKLAPQVEARRTAHSYRCDCGATLTREWHMCPKEGDE